MIILIIEDDAGITELLREKLHEEGGYETVCFQSADEALTYLAGHTPDLLLLDYGLPDMNGKEFLEACKTKGLPLPPFIVATGQGDERVAVEMMKLGARDYVVKDAYFLEMLPEIIKRVKQEAANERKLKQAEEKVLLTQALQRTALDSLEEAMHLVDTDLRIRLVNKRCREWFEQVGIEAAAVGRHLQDVCPFLDNTVISQYHQVLTTGIPLTTQEKETFGDRVIITETRKIPVKTGDKITGVLTIMADITAREQASESLRESEESYRELADSITDVFFAMDANLRYTYWNRASEKLTGIPAKEAMGKALSDIFPDTPQTRKAERIYRDVLKTQDPRTFVNEYQLEEKNLFLEISVYPSRHGLSVFVKNITERKQTEEDLKASQEYVRNIIDSSLDMIIAVDMKRRIVEFNKAAQETFGYLAEEVLGKHVDMLYADPREGLRIHQTTLRDGQCVQEVLNRRKDDQVFPCFLSASGLRNARGELVGIMGVSRDITARKQAEIVLAQSEKKFRTITEQMTDIVFVTDAQGLITYISPPVRKIFGFRHTIMEGRRFTEFLTPSEIDRAVSFFMKTISTGEPCTNLELIMKRKDGSVFMGELNATRYQADNFTGTIGLIRDISERKKAEETLLKTKALLEQTSRMARVGGWEKNLLTQDDHWTEMTREIHEVPPDFTPDMNTSINFYKEGEHREKIIAVITKAIETGEPFDVELQIVTAKGNERWLRAIGNAEFQEGRCVRLYGTFQDIDDRKRAEEALRQLNENLELRVSQRTAELEAANKELREFAYIVSHDLKAPLRGICQLAQWLREDYAQVLDEEGRAQIDLLMSRVRRMEKLISGILHYSRATHGSEYEEQIDLNTLVPQVIDMLSPPPHITIRIEQTLPVVHSDPIRITQVFQNLLNNAVKFMDKPDGQVTVGCVDSGEVWIFVVEDNGPGIELRHHERIFHIFQSCNPRDERESTGIGLTVVKKIVEFYGGRIWVESEPGRGSRFFFTWPKYREE